MAQRVINGGTWLPCNKEPGRVEKLDPLFQVGQSDIVTFWSS